MLRLLGLELALALVLAPELLVGPGELLLGLVAEAGRLGLDELLGLVAEAGRFLGMVAVLELAEC